LYKYNQQSSKINEKIIKFRNDNNDKMNLALQENDTVVINALRKEYIEIQDEMNKFSSKFAEDNPKAFLSVLIIENMINQPDFDAILVKRLFQNLSSDLKESAQGENIKKFLDNYDSTAIGSIAPDFSAPNPEGKIISLKESLGKVTIIDFWAAWCGPCRKENPNVVALYNELHEKGLNIIGVSLDREGDAAAWKQAIEVDRLTWPQVSNLKHWKEPIAEMYGVKSIPATYILDAEGRIVAKDLRGEDLRIKVLSLLEE
jgi:peroxiredoxin